MMDMGVPGSGLVNAQLKATVTYADAAAGASKIVFYSAAPATDPRAVPAAGVLVEVLLATPCGTVAGEVLTLLPAVAGGSMVMVGGVARWARWVRSDGQLVHAGSVTDAANGGFFWLEGGTVAAGETSPTLQAGGLVRMDGLVLG